MEYGIKCQLGGHIGASSLLTRAGLTLAAYSDVNFTFLEGAFENLLIETDLVKRPINYKIDGRIGLNENFPDFGYGNDIIYDFLNIQGSTLKHYISRGVLY